MEWSRAACRLFPRHPTLPNFGFVSHGRAGGLKSEAPPAGPPCLTLETPHLTLPRLALFRIVGPAFVGAGLKPVCATARRCPCRAGCARRPSRAEIGFVSHARSRVRRGGFESRPTSRKAFLVQGGLCPPSIRPGPQEPPSGVLYGLVVSSKSLRSYHTRLALVCQEKSGQSADVSAGSKPLSDTDFQPTTNN